MKHIWRSLESYSKNLIWVWKSYFRAQLSGKKLQGVQFKITIKSTGHNMKLNSVLAWRKKLSVTRINGEEGKGGSKSARTGNVPKSGSSSGVASTIDSTLPEPFTSHMQRFSQIIAKLRNERAICFSHHRVTVARLSGRSTVTDGPSTKPYQSLA